MGELRGSEAYAYLELLNTGHSGSITTVHADSASLAFEQLTLLVRESEGGRDLPRDDIRTMHDGGTSWHEIAERLRARTGVALTADEVERLYGGAA